MLLAVARGEPDHRVIEVLSTLVVYLSVACTFLPLPVIWIVLWAAREVGPLAVATAGALATCVANLHDYWIVSALWRARRVERFRATAAYGRAAAWFARAPFASLAVASFVPLPVDAVRLLAITVGYPRRLFVLATFAGRFPRYLLLAFVGHELALSNAGIAAVLGVTVIIGLAKGALALRERSRRGSLRAR